MFPSYRLLHSPIRTHELTKITFSQWDDTPNAGFTSGTPWLRVNDDYKEWNIARQVVDPGNSVCGFWKKAIGVRMAHEVLVRILQ